MRRRQFITLLGGATAVWPLAARAQQSDQMRHIAVLGDTPSVWNTWTAALAERLRELGWTDGRTVAIEYRWSEGRAERVAEFAARSALMLEGLRTQGLREPEQVVVLVRATGGDPARSAPLLAELVASKIDILLPMGGLTLTLAAEAAAANIPIVTFDFELDPVESGLLKSLAHPAGNVTGIFLDLPDISTASGWNC